jgi:hypothetical protein
MLRVPTSDPVVRREVDLSDLAPEIRDALAALAEVESRYEQDHECLEGWSGPKDIRLGLLDHLEARHRQERQPLVEHLAELYQHAMTASMFRNLTARQ